MRRATARGLLMASALAAAFAPPAPAAELQHSLTFAGEVAAPWVARQQPQGSFPDYMAVRGAQARDLYGHSMLGYGLLQAGLQRRDERLVNAGLRGLAYAVDHPRPFHSIVFEKLALAGGYNLARTRAGGNPLFVAVRERWEVRLRQMQPTWLGRGRAPYFNQHLVDAVTVIELARSGLRPPGPLLRPAMELVNRRLPRRLAGATPVAPDGALSYQALTLAFYARAVKLLGRRAHPRARTLLRRLARTSWGLSGPDGDVSYFGRSQQQAWGLALTAYGSEVAAERASPASAARYRALSIRALRRLRAVHGGGPHGLYLTPAFRTDHRAAVAAQEDYVSGSAYTGLTLLALGWAHDRLRTARTRPGRLASDIASRATLGRGRRRFTVLSTGESWMAVRRMGSGLDLLALKVRDRGRWRDLPTAALRPRGRPASRPRIALGSGCWLRITVPAGARWQLTAALPPEARRTGKREVSHGRVIARYRGAGHVVLGHRVSPAHGGRATAVFSARGPAVFSLGLSGCVR